MPFQPFPCEARLADAPSSPPWGGSDTPSLLPSRHRCATGDRRAQGCAAQGSHAFPTFPREARLADAPSSPPAGGSDTPSLPRPAPVRAGRPPRTEVREPRLPCLFPARPGSLTPRRHHRREAATPPSPPRPAPARTARPPRPRPRRARGRGRAYRAVRPQAGLPSRAAEGGSTGRATCHPPTPGSGRPGRRPRRAVAAGGWRPGRAKRGRQAPEPSQASQGAVRSRSGRAQLGPAGSMPPAGAVPMTCSRTAASSHGRFRGGATWQPGDGAARTEPHFRARPPDLPLELS